MPRAQTSSMMRCSLSWWWRRWRRRRRLWVGSPRSPRRKKIGSSASRRSMPTTNQGSSDTLGVVSARCRSLEFSANRISGELPSSVGASASPALPATVSPAMATLKHSGTLNPSSSPAAAAAAVTVAGGLPAAAAAAVGDSDANAGAATDAGGAGINAAVHTSPVGRSHTSRWQQQQAGLAVQ
eukprot:COSAG01_NODE_1782_length_9244_cov_115.552214_2_plen_183_part_00